MCPTARSVAKELSDDDVWQIEARIREVDPLPVTKIEKFELPQMDRPLSVDVPLLRPRPKDARGPEFEATTARDRHSIDGMVYRMSRIHGEWRITWSGPWIK